MNPRKTFAVVALLASVAVLGAPPQSHAEELMTIARDGKTSIHHRARGASQ